MIQTNLCLSKPGGAQQGLSRVSCGLAVLPGKSGEAPAVNERPVGKEIGEQMQGLAGMLFAIVQPFALGNTPELVQRGLQSAKLPEKFDRDKERVRKNLSDLLLSRERMASGMQAANPHLQQQQQQQLQLAASAKREDRG